MNRLTTTRGSINTVAICKGPEKYIVLFDDAHRSEALRQLGRWAANRELAFDWYDAAKASREIREGMKP